MHESANFGSSRDVAAWRGQRDEREPLPPSSYNKSSLNARFRWYIYDLEPRVKSTLLLVDVHEGAVEALKDWDILHPMNGPGWKRRFSLVKLPIRA